MTGEEEVDLVDGRDSVTGASTLGECLKGGLLHRAVAVQVVRSSGLFVLQQRSRRDLWHPGLWTISSTGHVKKGEAYESAAVREMKEELGLSAEVRFVKKHLLPPFRSGDLTEREWVAFYVARSDLPCRVDAKELEGVGEVSEEELRQRFKSGRMTPDAVIILRDYLGHRGKPGAL